MLGGICGGLSDFLGIDATFVRLFFIIFTLANGFGVLIYFLLWIIIPREDNLTHQNLSFESEDLADRAREMGQEFQTAVRTPHPHAMKYVGIGLLLMGFFLFVQNLDLPWLRWFDTDILWPVLVIAAGGIMIWRTFKGNGE